MVCQLMLGRARLHGGMVWWDIVKRMNRCMVYYTYAALPEKRTKHTCTHFIRWVSYNVLVKYI